MPAAMAPAAGAVAECGGSLNAVSASPDDRLLLVGGRDVLKVYALGGGGGGGGGGGSGSGGGDGWAPTLREVRNLRAARRKGLDLATVDVKWHPLLGHAAATGSTSGAVLVWDVSRPKGVSGLESTFRHARTVNRVAWHPVEPSWLLTGSQDGTARLWDARCAPGGGANGGVFAAGARAGVAAARAAAAATPRAATAALAATVLPAGGLPVPAHADSVRDVAFDPFAPLAFAAALEDGSVATWDVRRPNAPTTRFMAHVGLVMCLAWHPTQPGVLATGGRDRLVKVCGTRAPPRRRASARR
jgi:WD40 repeat protein